MYKIVGAITILPGLYIILHNSVDVFDGQVFFKPPLFYILLRSNLNAFDGQGLWSIFQLFFFDFLIPGLFIIGGAFIFKNKIRAIRFIAPIIAIDILKRIYDAISYFSAPDVPIPKAVEGTVRIIVNPWPSIIICSIDIIVLILVFRIIFGVKACNNSVPLGASSQGKS
ncbi:MAG: hypothetical protein OEV42_03360 [Deltaproteobacteria bacterium]|nr:hypothetical protein [Deltaproteobacteria bacterium]